MKSLKLIYVLTVMMLLAISGCTKDTGSFMTALIKADKDINPNKDGNPTPVVVMLYQLKDINNFKRAEFFRLYQQPQKTLGADYVSSQQFMLGPDITRKIPLEIKPGSKFLGVLAAFQQQSAADWQSTIPLNYWKSRVEIKLSKNKVDFIKK